MSQYTRVIVTPQGTAFLQDLLLAERPVTFTKVETSIQLLNQEDIATLTKLEHVQQTVPITGQSRVDATTYQVKALLSNDNIELAYHAQAIGIYVQGEEIVSELPEEPILDEEGNELPAPPPVYEDILYGVALAEEPFYMAPPLQSQVSLNLTLNIGIGSAEVMALNVNPAGAATYRDIQEVKLILDQELTALNDKQTINESVIQMSNAQQEASNIEIINLVMEIMGLL